MSICKKRIGIKRRCVCPKCKRKNVNLYPYGLFGWRCFKCGGRTYGSLGKTRCKW